MVFNHLIMCRCILLFYLLLQIILSFNVHTVPLNLVSLVLNAK